MESSYTSKMNRIVDAVYTVKVLLFDRYVFKEVLQPV